MQSFPHRYTVTAVDQRGSDVRLVTEHVPDLLSAAPAEFDGPGNRWSPETLLVAAVGDCFVLTFRAVARASRLPWTSLHCDVTGTLDRKDRVTQFTAIEIRACLEVPAGTDPGVAARILQKAEDGCLVSRSLTCPTHLIADVAVGEEALRPIA
jgi:organic hydroperoxide reductase OsmC/OhrA